MFKAESTYVVKGVEKVSSNVVRVMLEGEGTSLTMELPTSLAAFNSGDRVLVNLSSEKDPDYKSRWDIYMWGIVYYAGADAVRISVGGFIVVVSGLANKPNVGDKVYVGVKKMTP